MWEGMEWNNAKLKFDLIYTPTHHTFNTPHNPPIVTHTPHNPPIVTHTPHNPPIVTHYIFKALVTSCSHSYVGGRSYIIAKMLC